MRRRLLVVVSLVCLVPVVVLFAVVTLDAQTGERSPLEGVWKVTHIEVTGADPSTNASPQPSQIIFTRGYYSINQINGATARTPLRPPEPGKATDAEKLQHFDHWNMFLGLAGTYTIKGNVLRLRPLVAMGQFLMDGREISREFAIDGNTLRLVWRAGVPPSTHTQTLTRLE